MPEKFRVGITRDVLSPSGEPVYGRDALKVLDDPAVEWEYLPAVEAELSPEQASRYDAICVFGAKVSAKTVSGPNRRLKLIARFGVGYDSVDVPALTQQGILLTITPDGVRRPVASSVMAFILSMAHRLTEKDKLTREGRWKEKGDFLGFGLTGKTLGVIGVGNIGKEVFRLAKPWNMKHLGCDPYVQGSAVSDLGVQMVDLDTLLKQSDYISVHSPLVPETRGLFNAEAFKQMKPTAYIVNTARGPIIDEAALAAALDAKQISGAALDVMTQEPPGASHPLFGRDNVIITPHTSFYSEESLVELQTKAAEEVVAVLSGKSPRNAVNPEAF